ncbi:MAG: class II fumarate hydratase [Parachlamydiales bacterium]|nr:class II fumarate hydratase [Parachlamydiales bacterium]
MRKETDTLGDVNIDSKNLWGAQTQRSFLNFSIGHEKIPMEVIYALAMVKKASAIANYKLKLLSKEKKDLIVIIVEEILSKKHDEQFPLYVWQTGSGTHTNMNLNEVISNIASKKTKNKIGSKIPLNPNDDVNMGQSSNDVFPIASNIASYSLVEKELIPNLEKLKEGFEAKVIEFSDIIKVGRTHLMDAVPLTLSQEFSAYLQSIKENMSNIKKAKEYLLYLPLGATAVGTGLNAHEDFAKLSLIELCKMTGIDFKLSKNNFHSLAFADSLLFFHSTLKNLAVSFYKIAADISLSASGPNCGISELILPANEPGSSIMPGKVNPTQLEAMKMISMQVISNDSGITLSSMSSNFQLNTARPLIIFNALQSIHLLSDISKNFLTLCLNDIKPNMEVINRHLDKNLMIATALNQKIGYEKTAKIVQKAQKENISLKKAAKELDFINEMDFDEIINLKKMVKPHG